MYLADITLAVFTFFNILRFGSYLPQILRVATDQEGARAISYSTWCVWIGANLSTAAYTVVNITDWGLFGVSILNAAGCGAVVALTAWKRRQVARQQATRANGTRSALRARVSKKVDHGYVAVAASMSR